MQRVTGNHSAAPAGWMVSGRHSSVRWSCHTVMLSGFVAMSVSLTLKASLLQPHPRGGSGRPRAGRRAGSAADDAEPALRAHAHADELALRPRLLAALGTLRGALGHLGGALCDAEQRRDSGGGRAQGAHGLLRPVVSKRADPTGRPERSASAKERHRGRDEIDLHGSCRLAEAGALCVCAGAAADAASRDATRASTLATVGGMSI